MDWLFDRERCAFMRKLRIARLERATGFSVTYPEADLPTIHIVRNANDSLGWRPWVAVGFPGEDNTFGSEQYEFTHGYLDCSTAAGSARRCLALARERLYQIYLAQIEREQQRELVA